MILTWKMGFEIELLAPRGRSRRDLAERVARRHGGTVRRFFHPQSEPAKAKGVQLFENLTLGFEALDAGGTPVARFVDDLTLQDDLNRRAAPQPGWYRIVADDARLLRAVMHSCDAEASLGSVLVPLARIFGGKAEPHASGMVRISDDRGASVAIGALLPGERERPCEIVTAPIMQGHAASLAALLDEAAALGCLVPAEGATHIHFDAAPLMSAPVIANLVNALWAHGDRLKVMLETNPRCIRLGRWPEALIHLVNGPHFAGLAWPEAREALYKVGLVKYCDFNLLNIAAANAAKHTFEVRVLPVHRTAEPILAAAALFEAILRWSSVHGSLRPVPPALADWVAELQLDDEPMSLWLARAKKISP